MTGFYLDLAPLSLHHQGHWDTAFPSQTGKKADIITYYVRVDMDMGKQKHTLMVKYSNTAPVSNLTMLIKIKNLPYFWTGFNILAYKEGDIYAK